MSAGPILQLTNVGRRYNEIDRELVILDDASFSLGKGEMVALVAPSGAGKSTQ
jgi:lipoprotein-releasing system ATP-binding protein